MIKTIRLKDLIKYLVGLIIVIIIAISSTRFFYSISIKSNESKINLNFLLNWNLAIINNINKKDNKEDVVTINSNYTSRSGIIRILDLELPNISNNSIDEIEKEEIENDNDEEIQEKEERKEGELKESYTNKYGSVKIKNDTDIKLTETILKPDYKVKNYKDIIIYHTHTCESYTATKENKYKASGNYRTTDINYSVVKVGKELEKELKKRKFNITRNETKHDYPAYSGSYTRAFKTIENLIKNNSNTEIVFDIHRDAIGSNSDYAPTVEINGEKVAQLMFVIGTNDGGGKHPNWKNNLKFAVLIQEKANEMYPGLFRNINLRSATFNQKITNAASIIEVGATGNTLEEACASMKYLAKVLDAVLNNK